MTEQLLERLEKSKTKLNHKVGDKVFYYGNIDKVVRIRKEYEDVMLEERGWVSIGIIEPINKVGSKKYDFKAGDKIIFYGNTYDIIQTDSDSDNGSIKYYVNIIGHGWILADYVELLLEEVQ